jgi:hypothetical protein
MPVQVELRAEGPDGPYGSKWARDRWGVCVCVNMCRSTRATCPLMQQARDGQASLLMTLARHCKNRHSCCVLRMSAGDLCCGVL